MKTQMAVATYTVQMIIPDSNCGEIYGKLCEEVEILAASVNAAGWKCEPTAALRFSLSSPAAEGIAIAREDRAASRRMGRACGFPDEEVRS